jgi:hypothetical protein
VLIAMVCSCYFAAPSRVSSRDTAVGCQVSRPISAQTELSSRRSRATSAAKTNERSCGLAPMKSRFLPNRADGLAI